MYHRHGLACRRRHHVDFGIQLRECLFQNDHRKNGCASGNISRPHGDAVGCDHARARVTLWRAERNTRLQSARGVEQFCALFSQRACGFSRNQNFGEDILEFPRNIFRFEQSIELLDPACVVVVDLAINREHARGFANAHHLLPRQFPVDVARERGQVPDVFNMQFLVQYRLIKVRNAPALWNIELEQIGEFLRCLPSDCVAPCAERREQVASLIKCHVAVHHAAKADGANGFERGVVLFRNLFAEIAIAFLQARPNIFDAVCPRRFRVCFPTRNFPKRAVYDPRRSAPL